MRNTVIALSLFALVVTVAGAGWAVHTYGTPWCHSSASDCCYEGSPCCTPDCCPSDCCPSDCCTSDCCTTPTSSDSSASESCSKGKPAACCPASKPVSDD